MVIREVRCAERVRLSNKCLIGPHRIEKGALIHKAFGRARATLVAGVKSRLPHRVDGRHHFAAEAAGAVASVIQHDQAACRPP